MSSSTKMAGGKNILVFGATGFVGGDLLYGLLTDAELGSGAHKFGAITSSEGKRSEIEAWAKQVNPKAPVEVHVATRSKDDKGKSFYEAAERLSAQYDLVIQAATSDDLELTRAIDRGLAGAKGLLLHFSGVQLIESEPVGKRVDTPVYDDSDAAQIAGIADSAAHRLIDLEIERDRQAGRIARASAIVCPALVWGKGRGPSSPYSAQVPDMVTKALRNGQPVVVGEGTNEWTNVNVQEMTRFLVALVKAQLGGPDAHKAILDGGDMSQWETFYFAVSPHLHTFGEVAAAIGAALPAEAFPHGTSVKSLPVPPFDKSQKGVRVEDAARESGEQARIERFTPFWPDRTNNRAVAKRADRLPGDKPWFPTEYREQQMREDAKWIYECMQKAGNVPKCEV